MQEKIITENIGFTHLTDDNFTFPEIQKYLDQGFVIKSIFYSPLIASSTNRGVSITVHLSKQ